MNAQATFDRNKDLARIHILKKEAGLSETAYRAMVAGILSARSIGYVGQPSSGKLDSRGRYELIRTLERKIRADTGRPDPLSSTPWKGRYHGSGQCGEAGHLTTKQADEIARLEDMLGWTDNPKRLQGFIKRQTNQAKSVPMLTNRQASVVIVGLRRLLSDPYTNS